MKRVLFVAVLFSMSDLFSADISQCSYTKCRNINDGRRYLLNRQMSPDFPYANQQYLRKPTTGYISVEGDQALINFVVSSPNRFVAYDSKYDPAYNPCVDCDDSGNGNWCDVVKCFTPRLALVGQN